MYAREFLSVTQVQPYNLVRERYKATLLQAVQIKDDLIKSLLIGKVVATHLQFTSVKIIRVNRQTVNSQQAFSIQMSIRLEQCACRSSMKIVFVSLLHCGGKKESSSFIHLLSLWVDMLLFMTWLEKQVEGLKDEVEMKSKEKRDFEEHKVEIEKRVSELNLKIDKTIDKHEKLKKTERALKLAEVLLILQNSFKSSEATSKMKELMEVNVLAPYILSCEFRIMITFGRTFHLNFAASSRNDLLWAYDTLLTQCNKFNTYA
ncbi:hypothetical protein BC332_07286 [Capsicum chinense]|nr:hypothetical protein BC332_07286 [Capsicum chinense]